MPELKYQTQDRLLKEILPDHKERSIFRAFLEIEKEGVSIGKRLYQQAQANAQLPENGEITSLLKEEVVQAVVRKYKGNPNEGNSASAYDLMVLDLIAKTEGFYGLVSRIKRGTVSPEALPRNFPGMRKRAEILLKGKIAADLKPKDVKDYLAEKTYASVLRGYARDLFFAVNNGAGERVIDFLMAIYNLESIKTAEPITSLGLRKIILDSLVNRHPLDIIHIKSLRFTYPEGRRLRILEDTAEVTQDGLPGERRKYPSEEVIFSRIERLKKIFSDVGIQTRVTIIVSGFDIDFCFPAEQKIVPIEDISLARVSAQRYVDYLKDCYSSEITISSLGEFLKERSLGGEYDRIFNLLAQEGYRGGGKVVKGQTLEMRVSEQFEHYRKMFGAYSRNLARYTAIRQIANLLSLSLIFQAFPRVPLLVIDSRGFEDELIGGCQPGCVVKFFTKLKDAVEINKN